MSGDRVGNSWDWARLVPPSEWIVPDDIKSPTSVPTANLFIAILASEKVGNDVHEAVGELIAEEARFNVWYATAVNGKVPPERQAAVHAISRDVVQRIYEPWAAFMRACAAEREATERAGDYIPLADVEYNAILEALRSVRRELVEARRSLDEK